MKPASHFPAADARALLGVLFDLDDTVLDGGRLTLGALRALYRLHDAGLILVGVTGRPAAWGQVLVRQWPVSGMVTENGIIALIKRGNAVVVLDRAGSEERRASSQRLAALVREMREQFPELVPSDDVSGRLADYSFDIAESHHVPGEVVAAATEVAKGRGARVVRSSIQLHVSYDVDDKASGVVRFLREQHGIDPTLARFRFAFIGDSENDGPCFSAFHSSFGVANLRGRSSLLPRYLATAPMGAGFAEITDVLLAARRGP